MQPIWPCPAIPARPLKNRSHQSFKLLVRRLKFRVAVMDNFRRSALERLLGGDAVQPPLFGKFFVRRKIQPDQQADSSIGGCCRFFCGRRARFRGGRFPLGLFRRFSFGFFRCRRLWGGLELGESLDARAVGPVQLVLQVFVEPKGLAVLSILVLLLPALPASRASPPETSRCARESHGLRA